MNNAERILAELDARLNTEVELTLYGRAALSLGYPSPPPEFGQSMDVDCVLAVGQAEKLLETTNFWQAIDETNHALSEAGLYVSHLFVEDQVILTEQWKEVRIPIKGPWRHLRLSRLGDQDLLLSKLMRDDPHDRSDALFIALQAGMQIKTIKKLLKRAVVPESPELTEQFHMAADRLIEALPNS
jgi:hypothetical protein